MAARSYLDWNATAPLRPEARAAMLEAMDVVGNPSSVHAEGRAARAIVEKARGQVARLVGCEPTQLVITSGATEAAATLGAMGWDRILCSDIEHDAVAALTPHRAGHVLQTGQVDPDALFDLDRVPDGARWVYCLTAASSETGVLQPLSDARDALSEEIYFAVDATQAIGRITERPLDLVDFVLLSGHKLGSGKGVGCLIVRPDTDPHPLIAGGGQEMGRRSGTENVIGIAGFGAAAEAAQRDLEAGVWERVEKLRDILENALAESSAETIFVGKGAPRLPNTSCFATPGWKGETQVMQMDLAGYAISAGSACSSGKVKESRVLRAMGFDSETASSAIRVSLGPTTTEDEVLGFASTWSEHHRRWRDRRR